jgi:hypothetical protein
LEELRNKYNCPNSALNYNALKDAIPQIWRKILKKQPITDTFNITQDEPTIKSHKLTIPFKNITNQTLYWIIINKIKTEPVTKTKWKTELGISELEWGNVFLNNKTIRQTKIQAFQYKILFNLTPCNLYLHRIGKSDSAICNKCNSLDDIVHYFSECTECRSFWNSLNVWWNRIHSSNLKLTKKEIMVGITSNHEHKETINAIIMLAKWYIFSEKLENCTPFLYKFLCCLKFYLNIEKIIYSRKEKILDFNKIWFNIEQVIT